MLENILNTRAKRFSIAALVFIAFVSYIVFLVLTYSAPANYVLTSTPLAGYSHSLLKGDSLYTYNGLSFLKKDVPSGNTTVLASGEDIGTIDYLQWVGDKGVLMSILGGYGPGLVTEAIEREGIELIDTPVDSLFWYYDFEKNSLSLLERDIDLNTYIAVDSENSHLYYLSTPGSSYELYGQTASIVSYEFETGETEEYYTPEEGSFVRFLSSCPDADLCAAIRSTGDSVTTKLIKFVDSSPEEIVSTDGVISFTSQPGTMVVTKQISDSSVESNSDEYEVDYGVMNAEFFDTGTGKRQNTGFQVSSDDFYTFIDGSIGDRSAHFVAVGSGVALADVEVTTNNTSVPSVRGAFSLLGKVSTTPSEMELPEDAELLFFPSSVDYFNQLIDDTSGSVYRLSTSDKKDLVSLDNSKTEKIVKLCSEKTNAVYEYSDVVHEYRISANYSDNRTMTSGISSFSNCLTSEGDAGLFIGYWFNFAFTDQVSGREVIP